MKTLLISAIYTSPPTTMGGNTKIMLEMLQSFSESTDFKILIFTTEPETFKKYLKISQNLEIVLVPFPFKKLSVTSHINEIFYLVNFYENYFKKFSNLDSKDTLFYSCSDWWADVLPIGILKLKNYKFLWISTLFLFIPDIFSNIINKYNFPLIKYFVYYFYQKIALYFIKKYSYKTIITNDFDKKFFPTCYQDKLFAIYGGVDNELIDRNSNPTKEYEAVFCGRIHPQKGVNLLIEIWSLVVKFIPNARLIIIGNGEDSYTNKLKKFVKDLGIENNVYFLGYINDKQKFDLYLKSKILLHTSVYDNNGMVAAEALCSGIPVIMFDHDYLKKIYTDYCIKVPVNNTKQYALEVIKLLSNSEVYNKLSPKGIGLQKLRLFWDFKRRSLELVSFITKK